MHYVTTEYSYMGVMDPIHASMHLLRREIFMFQGGYLNPSHYYTVEAYHIVGNFRGVIFCGFRGLNIYF